MNLAEMAERVDSKESFLFFVQALAAEAEAADAEPCSIESPWGWENRNIEAFLDAMAAWAASDSGTTGEPTVSEQPSWHTFAEILYAGKFYERI